MPSPTNERLRPKTKGGDAISGVLRFRERVSNFSLDF